VSEQQSHRGEAFSWVLMHIQTLLAASGDMSRVCSPKSGNRGISPTVVKSIKGKERSFSSDSSLSSESQSSISGSSNKRKSTHIVQPSFAIFRSFLKEHEMFEESIDVLRVTLDHRMLLQKTRNTSELQSRFSSMISLSLVDKGVCQSPESGDQVMSRKVLIFLCYPIFGDNFVIKPYRGVLKRLDLDGGIGLTKILPLFIRAVELSQWPLLITSLLASPSASNTFQKWIREILFEFQDFLHTDFDDDSGSTFTENKLSKSYQTDLMREIVNGRRLLGLNDRVDSEPATFDEAVRQIFMPCWFYIRESCSLEVGMLVTVLLTEVFEIVHEQIEKKSYGLSHLRSSIQTMKVLFRQLRVTLLLKVRSDSVLRGLFPGEYGNIGQEFTVNSLDSGDISIFGLLVMDTLCFAMQYDHAVQHERKCQEVYMKRVVQHQDSPAGGGRGGVTTPLLVWTRHDSRWKEILAIVADDVPSLKTAPSQFTAPSSSTSSPVPIRTKNAKGAAVTPSGNPTPATKSRRPLLLFFPFHNQPDVFGIYRSLFLMSRWCKSPSKLEIFHLSVSHLSQLTGKSTFDS